MTAFTTHLADAFCRFCPIETRRMFSGAAGAEEATRVQGREARQEEVARKAALYAVI